MKSLIQIWTTISKFNFISSNLSSSINIASKGRSHLLLRTLKKHSSSKRNIVLCRNEESKSEQENDDVDLLKDKMKSFSKQLIDKEVQQNEKYADLLADLSQKGIIDENGNFINK